jgi:pilus assembly protein CpaF
MLKKSLTDEFNIKLTEENSYKSDYDIFQDKNELDTLRRHILEKLGDLTYVNGDINRDTIITVINKETEGRNLTNLERSHLFNIIDNEINGYGPLSELLKDENINEIMVNGPDEIFIDINGEMVKDLSVSFINNEHIIRTIKKLLRGTNIQLDGKDNISAKLYDGSTLNVILPPLSLRGPILTIKKFNDNISKMDDLLKIGSLTPYMARFLDAAVQAKLNILICGSNSSGKTSLLNSLGNLIEPKERIITCESINELKINKPNLIKLDVSDNLSCILKMDPDTVIIGELNHQLIGDCLNIMLSNNNINVLTTILSNDAIDAVNKMENYFYNTNDTMNFREKLYNAIDIIVTIKEMKNHKHRITSIAEFNKNKNDEIIIKEIFAYKESDNLNNKNDPGEYSLYKYLPRSYEKIKKANINLADTIFENIK